MLKLVKQIILMLIIRKSYGECMELGIMTLQCFLAVAQSGSFTQAAKQIHRTQSAVSQQIAKLEQTLNVQLIERGKSITLTHDGEVFLNYAREIYRLQSEALDRFKQPELVGVVRFGLPEDFASVLLTSVLTEFNQSHPRVLLNVECDLTLNLLARFKQGDFDLVLVKMSHPRDFPNGVDVMTEKLEWVGHDAILRRLNDQALPLVLSPEPCVYRTRALNALTQRKIPWHIVFTSPSYAGTIAAVKAGMGITVLPHAMIPEGLIACQHTTLPSLQDTHLSILKQNADSPAINTLEQKIVARLQQY
jgi:DNA-binding transcriptional LysR family regulator